MAKQAGSKANALANAPSKSHVHTKANMSIIEVETIHTKIEKIYKKVINKNQENNWKFF